MGHSQNKISLRLSLLNRNKSSIKHIFSIYSSWHLLWIVVLGGEESLQPLDVERSCLEAVGLRGQPVRRDPVHEQHEVRLATTSKVNDGQIQIRERPQLPLLRRLERKGRFCFENLSF